jgi:hypothetical protein
LTVLAGLFFNGTLLPMVAAIGVSALLTVVLFVLTPLKGAQAATRVT